VINKNPSDSSSWVHDSVRKSNMQTEADRNRRRGRRRRTRAVVHGAKLLLQLEGLQRREWHTMVAVSGARYSIEAE
jgi:hypothetical protein